MTTGSPGRTTIQAERNSGAARLQKVLAAAGVGSRRHLEALIEAGRITVNGQPASLGARVAPGDSVRVDGRQVRIATPDGQPRVILYHKPAGEIVSRQDPRGRPTVFERLPVVSDSRWVAVGRLDFNTSGLLLFTDSGELAHRLMHPSFGLVREYAVRVLGVVRETDRRRLLDGIKLDDGVAKLESLEASGGTGSNRWYTVTLSEGRNREVRRLFAAVGLTVSRLIRIAYGDLRLPPQLRQGRAEELPPDQVDRLVASLPSGASKTRAALF